MYWVQAEIRQNVNFLSLPKTQYNSNYRYTLTV